jgi:hypothetical protein
MEHSKINPPGIGVVLGRLGKLNRSALKSNCAFAVADIGGELSFLNNGSFLAIEVET